MLLMFGDVNLELPDYNQAALLFALVVELWFAHLMCPNAPRNRGGTSSPPTPKKKTELLSYFSYIFIGT